MPIIEIFLSQWRANFFQRKSALVRRALLLVGCLITGLAAEAQKKYIDKQVEISFFSSTPVEDIEAYSRKGVGVLEVSSGAFFFKVPMKSFTFPKALMQEHFNENYVESDKYPYATFKGKLVESFKLQEGRQQVMAEGEFTVHGKTQRRTIPGTVTVVGDTLFVEANFEVPLVDHDIKVPRVVIKNIAEVIQVQVKSNMIPAEQQAEQ